MRCSASVRSVPAIHRTLCFVPLSLSLRLLAGRPPPLKLSSSALAHMMQHTTAPAGPRGGGARRVYNCGNLSLSTLIFFLALVTCMTALDPRYTHIFLSARHRTPPLTYVESSLLGGFTPVTVKMGNRTGLVVPATGAHGTRDIAAALAAFFADDVKTPPTSPVTAAAAQDGGEVKPDDAPVTLSDVYAVLLLSNATKSSAAGVSSSTRRPTVVHLCSALACAMPFVAQQWANRAALLWRLSNKTADTAAVAVPPITNFALVFGESREAAAVLEKLAEQRVLTPQQAPLLGDSPRAMPLVGEARDLDGLEASCNALGQCRYRAPLLHRALAESLGVTTQEEPASLSSVSGVVAEWWRRGNGTASHESWHNVAITPASSTVYGGVYKLSEIAIDLVHVDVLGADDVAAFAFLQSVWKTGGAKTASWPTNILVTLHASEWMPPLVAVLDSIEQSASYAAIPLHRSCLVYHRDSFSPSKGWRLFGLEDDLGHVAGGYPAYLNPRLSRSRGVQHPLCTVLLSRTFATLDALVNATAAARPGKAVVGTAVERFLYDALGISPADDARLLTADVTTESDSTRSSTTTVVDVAKRLVGLVVQYFYFVIPIAVGTVLTLNVCRRRGRR